MLERAGSYFRGTLAAPVADLTRDGAEQWQSEEFRDGAEMNFTHELTKQTLER
jgi:hypothetical protein